MHRSRAWILASFSITAALIGAITADPLVEGLSNAGAFGAGRYTDRSMIDILPVLLIIACSVALWVFVQVKKTIGQRIVTPEWIHRSALALDARSVVRIYPIIFTLQMIALFSMETLEQLAVYGHILGPLVWLGGPLLVSVLAHALACAAATYGLLRVLRRMTTVVLIIVQAIARFFTLTACAAQPFASTRTAFCVSRLLPLLCRIGERAPPISA